MADTDRAITELTLLIGRKVDKHLPNQPMVAVQNFVSETVAAILATGWRPSKGPEQ